MKIFGRLARSKILGVVGSVLFCLLYLSAAEVQAVAAPKSEELSVRWEVISQIITKDTPDGISRSQFTLTNRGAKPLPSTHFFLYFNCMSGARTVTGEHGATVSHINGSLYRMDVTTPKPLAAGETLTLWVDHSEIIVKSEKAPIGPYIVFDKAQPQAMTITDFTSVPLSRQPQLEGAPDGVNLFVSPEEIYAQNALIEDVALEQLPPVFPSALKVTDAQGVLNLKARPVIVASKALALEARFAAQLFKPYVQLPQAGPKATRAHTVRLKIKPLEGQTSPDAYVLDIDPKLGITITGNSASGVFYGLQSLGQLLPLNPKAQQVVSLKSMRIQDAPRYAYRGLLVDVARNFHTKEELFELIDLMARYKLNNLHLHLTDDEGWRLQIMALPELTSLGARRGHTTDASALSPAHGSGADLSDSHGSGYYTQADYIEILQYAKARHVQVIPEFEMPGHARAAVKAMEARYFALKSKGVPHADRYLISDLKDTSTYRSAQEFSDNVINPALPSTYAFIEVVIAEMAAMHQKAGVPLHTLHVGADELAHGAWEGSPAVKAFMAQKGLITLADMWDYFYGRVEKIAQKHGANIAGWEELGVRKVKSRGKDKYIPNPQFVGHGVQLFVWNNLEGSEDLAYRLANAGYTVILAPATNLYFDMAFNRDALEPGHNWANYIDLYDVFVFDPENMVKDPLKEALSDYGARQIVGLEATLFSETMRTPERLEYMTMPRLLALAERAWGAPVADQAKEWTRFTNQLGKQVLPRLDAQMPQTHYRIPPPGLKRIEGKVLVNAQLPGLVARYTTDGSTPTEQSPAVTGPILSQGVITVALFNSLGRSGHSSVIDNK